MNANSSFLGLYNTKVLSSTINNNYLFYTRLDHLDKNAYINILVHNPATVTTFTSDITLLIAGNDCATTPSPAPSTASRRVYSPIAYIALGGVDYIAALTTGGESSSICTAQLGFVWLFRSNYPTVELYNAIQAGNYYTASIDPGGLPGFATFNGYVKWVDVAIIIHVSTPRILSMGYYENT